MTFQDYLANIEARTGKGPDDFRRLAEEKGFTRGGRLADGVRAMEIVRWLQDEHQLGHGHAMAIVALLKGKRPGG